MDEKQKDFYVKLRSKINTYLQKHDTPYAEFLLLGPDLFHLLVKLSIDERIPSEKKLKFIAVIAYFISPIDFLPEMFLGPLGYFDDIALTAYVINQYVNETDSSIVRELWAGDQDVLTALKNIISSADKFIGSGLWKKIRQKF